MAPLPMDADVLAAVLHTTALACDQAEIPEVIEMRSELLAAAFRGRLSLDRLIERLAVDPLKDPMNARPIRALPEKPKPKPKDPKSPKEPKK